MTSDALAERLRQTFLAELDEQLAVLDTELLALEGEAAGDPERLANVFRVAHTLKGAARVSGVPLVESVCHALESLLADVRAGRRTLGADEFALLFAAVDALADAGRRMREGQPLADSPLAELDRRLASGFQGQLGSGAGGGVAGVSGVTRAHPAGAAGGVSGDGGMATAEEGGIMYGRPLWAPTRGAPTPPRPPEGRREVTPDTPDTPRAAGAQADAHVRIATVRLDELLSATGELTVTVARAATQPALLRAVADDLATWARRWRHVVPRMRQAMAGDAAGLETRDALDALDAELRRIATAVARQAELARGDTRALERAGSDVAEGVYRLRTRPFAEAAEALPRAVRDVATAAGVDVELRVEGGEIEADRAVLDAVREALLHLVRNAVDHGIEPPDERVRRGKPARGTITVRAAIVGERLRVTVADDGRGLDVAAVRAQLAERGRAVPDDEDELARALFEGGFSTRREATAISGRGVGLDVVQAVTARARGTVDVRWTAGRGTTFVLDTPLTLATVRALVVRVGDERLAIPTDAVVRLLRVRAGELRLVEGRQILPLPDGPLPLSTLARLLGPPLVDHAPSDAPRPVVLLAAAGRRIGLAVDELLEETELVVRPVERRGAGPLPHVAGAAVLADGGIALVLTPAALLATGLGRRGRGGDAVVAAPSAKVAAACILVVDDSITTRTLEQSVLEAAGYEVVTAVDGDDGWRLLQERGADLVLSDVEMPRMDGFTLCETIRASKRFAQLPVVLVTSLEDPAHRARGMEAGADAYVVKSGFDQEALLATVRELLAREHA